MSWAEDLLNDCGGVARTVVICRHFYETVGVTEAHSA